MKLRDKFPKTQNEASKFGAHIKDSCTVFKIFEIVEPISEVKNQINSFLLENGYEVIPFAKLDSEYSYDSDDDIVSLSLHGYEESFVLFISKEEYRVPSREKQKTDSCILCGRILQIFIDKGFVQVDGYNKFTYISHKDTFVLVGREKGKDTRIPFGKIIETIVNYQINPDDYDRGPGKTRDYGLTHINSPVWALLHLLEKGDYLS
jgi:hypothetical protein